MAKSNDTGLEVDLPLMELFILVVAVSICVWAWNVGGVFGLAGCFCGAIANFNKRSVLEGAFAGLWAGVILGGLFGSAIARLIG